MAPAQRIIKFSRTPCESLPRIWRKHTLAESFPMASRRGTLRHDINEDKIVHSRNGSADRISRDSASRAPRGAVHGTHRIHRERGADRRPARTRAPIVVLPL